MERNCSSFSTLLHRGRLIYVEARLQGGAPWGFTLKGGLEHGEALIISKVEEGGKADLLQHPLLVGDEVVNINEVELSGSRQEAISLVKGSYKSLQLTVCRDSCLLDPCCSEADVPPCLSPPYSHGPPRQNPGCPSGVELRIKNRRSEPASRPHSWHSTKLGEGQPDSSMTQISQGSVGTPWHQTYHSSASTTDLSSYDPGYLRKSPDQYSSRGSMESLDHGHPAYSSCQRLSPSKSSGSIDHLHSKRDSAYSSFSTSSSVPEYPAAAGLPMGTERSYSADSMLAGQQRGPEAPRQADIRYVRTVYDAQQGISEEHEVSTAGFLRGGEGRAQAEARGGGSAHRSSSSGGSGSSGSSSGSSSGNSASNRHSVGPVWGSARQHNSYESLKGAPPPPQRSDSFAAIRNHERPSSWSSLEQARSMRSLYKGSWHHSSGSVAGGKPLFATEGQQLHTLEEKSPESSPTTRPRQGLPQAPSMGRLMLPTGIYQVPPPEPHFAQAPATCPNSSSVYPALAKESRGNPAGDWSSGAGRDGPVVENGYQSSSTSSTTGQPPSVPQPKSPSQQMDRQPEELQASCSLYRPHFKPHAESHTVPHLQGEEHSFRRDPYTPVQQRGERQRHLQGPESMEMYTQAQDEEAMVPLEPSAHLESALPQTNVVFSECRSSLGGHRDGSIQNTRGSSGAPQSQQSEHGSRAAPNHQGALQQEHPLTRLENALAEVQKAAIPERRASQSGSQGAQREEVPAGRVSVLEKVSRFEQQHRQGSSLADGVSQLGKLRSQSTSLVGPESRAKSFGVPPHMRTQSYSAVSEDDGEQACLQRRRSTEHHQPWSSPQSALQRSKSTFHLGEENGKKDFLWREDLQDILGTIQDTSFNTAYRDSLKDAQSKVLRSTSFRRKDLSVEQHPSSKHLSLERKGPKTLPKPHTPKERHMVTPELGGTAVPALPSVPPVGPPTVRIGGRKRLTLEQKKRCYSEPEKMNEVGVSEDDGCLSAYGKGPDQLHLAEASVADRRRLFELAAHRSIGPGPNLGPWPGPVPGLASSSSFRSDLKQLQHDALAEYMERKTGRRVPRSQRPQSAYLQPPSYSSDSQSLSSTSSLLSLQDPELQEASGLSAHHKGGRVSSTLPPGLQGYLYPSGNPARPPSSSESTSSNSSAHKPRARPQRFFSLEQELDRPVLVTLTQPPQSLRLARHCDKAFERAAPARTSGKSASAEDLLDRSEEIAIPQHFRSRSSPSVEKLNQDAMTEYRLHTMFSKEPAPAIPTETRAVEGAGQFPSQQMERYLSSPGSLQLKTPVSRRDKQRQSERQRAQSMSGLAASVGLPCPFSSPRPSDSLSQASLEVLAHGLLPAAAGAVSPRAHTARKSSGDSGTSGETLTDVPVPVAAEEVPPAPSGEARNSPLTPPFHHDLPPAAHHGCPSPAESPVSAPATPLPFLRISESSIHFSSTPPLLPEEDEVFLPPPPPPPASPPPLPLPIWEEDFPPPPPPPPVLPPLAAEGQEYVEIPRSPTAELSLQSTYSLDHSAASRGTVSPVPSPLPVTPDLQPAAPVSDPGTEAESLPPASVLEMEASWEAQESLELEYPVLSKRERSAEEVRVETLARELLSKDKSLTPVLDNWAVQKAMELMEEVFPASVLPRQQRTSSRLDDRRQDRGSAAEDTPVQRENGGQAEMETDLDEEELDLSQKKVELVQALSQSVAVLRGEKEALAEEQRRCSALSARVEALVKELCKANEYEKYRMFVGDLERMVGLLLSLCGQLARVESGLSALEGEETQESAEERETLQKRRRKLCGQHEDALELKENLDRRERLVLDILGGYLSGPQLREYQRLVRVKPALLIRQRRLEELIRHGEGQLHRLGEHLQPGNQDPALRPGPCASPPPPCSTAVTSL